MKVIIGDIHACSFELKDLLDKIGVGSDDQIIALGDIFDRGPDNKGILELFSSDFRFFSIKGNHERKHLLVDSGDCQPSLSQLITREELNKEYPALLGMAKKMLGYIELDKAILVHGSLQPCVPLSEQKETILVGSMRGERVLRKTLDKPWYEVLDLEKPVIFGHIVQEKPFIFRDRVYGIDTGCCHGGSLSALVLPDFKMYSVKARKDYWAEAKKRYGHIHQMNDLKSEIAYYKATDLLKEKTNRVTIREAINLYQRALSCKPGFADAHIMLGYAYLKQAILDDGDVLGCLEKASDSFLEGMRYDPSFEKTVGPDIQFLEAKKRGLICTIQ